MLWDYWLESVLLLLNFFINLLHFRLFLWFLFNSFYYFYLLFLFFFHLFLLLLLNLLFFLLNCFSRFSFILLKLLKILFKLFIKIFIFIFRNFIQDWWLLPKLIFWFSYRKSIKSYSFNYFHFRNFILSFCCDTKMNNMNLILLLPFDHHLSIMVNTLDIIFLIIHHLNHNNHLLICLLKNMIHNFWLSLFFNFLFLVLFIIFTHSKFLLNFSCWFFHLFLLHKVILIYFFD